jgi:hypothetical protein
MSGPQHIAWFETAKREIAGEKLRDLEVLIAPNEERQFYGVRDRLIEMNRGQNDG